MSDNLNARLHGMHRKRDPNWKSKRFCPTAIVKRLIAWHENDGSIEDLTSLILDAQKTMEPKDNTRKSITLDLSDLLGEEWRPLVGGEGKYDVSNMGRVRSYAFKMKYGWGWGDKPHHVLQGAITARGYRTCCLRGAVDRIRQVHNLVLEAFVGTRPYGMVGRHRNGNPGDNRLVNLSWGTQAENAADRSAHERVGKLNLSSVAAIRDELRTGTATTKQLARRFEVTTDTVKSAARGKSWSVSAARSLDRVPRNGDEINPPRGTRNPQAKITDHDAYEIRQLLKAGNTQRVVGDLYGIEQTVVHALAVGRTWKHVPFPPEEST